MAEPARRRATYDDLEAVPDGLVAELVNGSLETHPRPRPRHAAASGSLLGELVPPFALGRGGPGGWIIMVEPELHLSADVLVPDIAGWRRERLSSEPAEPFVTVAPDWVCEILSPSTARLDRGAKRRLYAKAGISYLWMLDPVARELDAFGLAGARWVLLATIQPGETVGVAPFDAVSFPLDDLFPFDEPSTPAPEA